MPSQEFLKSDTHLGDRRLSDTRYWSKSYNQFHMEDHSSLLSVPVGLGLLGPKMGLMMYIILRTVLTVVMKQRLIGQSNISR